jgi:hypothetical protein
MITQLPGEISFFEVYMESFNDTPGFPSKTKKKKILQRWVYIPEDKLS